MEEKRLNGTVLLSKYRTAVMGFAALCILIFHEFEFSLSWKVGHVEIFPYIKAVTCLGVDIFLFMSGIGLTGSMSRNSVPKFYFNRFIRIFPPFLVLSVLKGIRKKWGLGYFLKTVSGITFVSESIFVILWFIPAIMILYLCFPWYYKLIKKAENKEVFTVFAISIWFILTMFFRDTKRDDLFVFTNRIPIFLTGVLYGFRKEDEAFLNPEKWDGLLAVFVTGLYCLFLVNFRDIDFILPNSPDGIPPYLVAVSLPFLLTGLLEKIRAVRFVGRGILSVLNFYGKISLELYCVQEEIGERIKHSGLTSGISAFWWDCLILAVSTLAAYLLWTVDTWLITLLKKSADRRKIHIPWDLTKPAEFIKKNSRIIVVVTAALLLILFWITSKGPKYVYSGKAVYDEARDYYRTEEMELDRSGDYEAIVKYSTDHDTEINFVIDSAPDQEEKYPAVLSKDSGELEFPLTLTSGSEKMYFTYPKEDGGHLNTDEIDFEYEDPTVFHCLVGSCLFVLICFGIYFRVQNENKKEPRT